MNDPDPDREACYISGYAKSMTDPQPGATSRPAQTLAAVGCGCGVEERNTADADKGAAMRRSEERKRHDSLARNKQPFGRPALFYTTKK